MVSKGPNTDAYLRQLSEIIHLPGDVAECGVYKGYNTYHYATLLQDLGSNKKIHAFDTFCGLPKESLDPVDLSRFDDASLEEVHKLLSSFKNVYLHCGTFQESFPEVSKNDFCCVILDCDLYESYKESLNFFYPRLVSGGVFILDEYYSVKYPLARIAVDSFCKTIHEKPEIFHVEDNGWERWRIVKK